MPKIPKHNASINSIFQSTQKGFTMLFHNSRTDYEFIIYGIK